MDWQLPLVIVIVTAAAAYVARKTWRAWLGTKAGGCGGGCGCASKATEARDKTILIPVNQLGLRRDRSTAESKRSS